MKILFKNWIVTLFIFVFPLSWTFVGVDFIDNAAIRKTLGFATVFGVSALLGTSIFIAIRAIIGSVKK